MALLGLMVALTNCKPTPTQPQEDTPSLTIEDIVEPIPKVASLDTSSSAKGWTKRLNS